MEPVVVCNVGMASSTQLFAEQEAEDHQSGRGMQMHAPTRPCCMQNCVTTVSALQHRHLLSAEGKQPLPGTKLPCQQCVNAKALSAGIQDAAEEQSYSGRRARSQVLQQRACIWLSQCWPVQVSGGPYSTGQPQKISNGRLCYGGNR